MKTFKHLATFFLLLLIGLPVSAQNNSLQIKREWWKAQAEAITNNISKDSSKLDNLTQALIFSRIGDAWYESDLEKANFWFEKSVDKIFFFPEQEKKSEIKEYLSVTGKILQIISVKNQKQAGRLMRILSETESVSENEKNSNADLLIDFAFQTAKENPKKAAQIGIKAFRIGNPKTFTKLLWEIRRYDTEAADLLFREAFLSSQKTLDYQMLQSIRDAAFPPIENFPPNLLPPEPVKNELLNFFADYILSQQTKYTLKTVSNCTNEAGLVLPLQSRIETLLPHKHPAVKQALMLCLDNKSNIIKETNAPDSREATAEDLLFKADNAKDNELLRGAYLMKAIAVSYKEKNYELIIKIIDGMSETDLESNKDFFESMRFEAAALLAFSRFEENASAEALRILEKVPAEIRHSAQITFVNQFSPQNKETYSFVVQILNDARVNLNKSEKPFSEKSYFFSELIRLYALYELPIESAESLRNFTKSYNEAFEKNAEDAKKTEPHLLVSVIPAKLLENQSGMLFDSANALKDMDFRCQMNLGFLRIALTENKKIAKQLSEKTGNTIKK